MEIRSYSLYMKATDYLKARKYPGRIIGMGMTRTGKRVVIYAIMGRSKGSRNRIFRFDGKTLSVLPFTDEGTGNTDLTVYEAFTEKDGRFIAANGNHLNTIINDDEDLLSSLSKCTYEPDPPIFTPRIAGIMNNDGSFTLGIVRKGEEDAEREMFSYPQVTGKIHLIHTYEDDGNPPSPFTGMPPLLDISEEDVEKLSKSIWDSLDADNRVSLFVLVGNESRIINKNEIKNTIKLKYGLNPNQKDASISITGRELPVTVLNGKPGYINFLDALSGYALVKDLKTVLGMPAAASFKHVSPSGAAVSVPLSEKERRMYFIKEDEELSEIATSYIRARGTDRMSSFGDFISLSDTCDECTARLIAKEVSDGIIAPGFTEEALAILSKKKKGAYPIILINKDYTPEGKDIRTLYGMTLEEDRNIWIPDETTFSNIVTENKDIPESARRDLIVSLLALKYTASNSVCYAYNGQTIGVGAGQQSRIHCTRLAGDKADRWLLRQADKVLSLPFRKGMSRNDKDNAIEQYLSSYPEIDVVEHWEEYFSEKPERMTEDEKKEYLSSIKGVSLSSDAFFPFSDNIIRAARSGVSYIAEPGGSVRDEDVIKAADSLGITMCFTGIRLFQH